MCTPALIEVRGLSKAYSPDPRDRVLKDLNLHINAGEIVAVVGRSGSGKSTLLNMVGLMDTPDSGDIRYNGENTAHWDDGQRTAFRRRTLGFVFQSFNLIPTLTVYENVCLPLELNGIAPADRVTRMLGRLGIAACAERFPEEISGGEQQRAAIARALVHQPALIVADEPTGNLDHETGSDVVRLFAQSAREHGVALVMATHSVEMLGGADRILAMKDGRLIESKS